MTKPWLYRIEPGHLSGYTITVCLYIKEYPVYQATDPYVWTISLSEDILFVRSVQSQVQNTVSANSDFTFLKSIIRIIAFITILVPRLFLWNVVIVQICAFGMLFLREKKGDIYLLQKIYGQRHMGRL